MTVHYWIKVGDGDVIIEARETVLPEGESFSVPNGYIDVTGVAGWTSHDAMVGRKTYAGGAFSTWTPPASTIVSKYAFLSLLTEAEDAGIDYAEMTLSGGSAPQKAVAAKIRAWRRRMDVADHIDLALPAVATQLAGLKQILIPSVWADEAAADARIAQILAGTPPA